MALNKNVPVKLPWMDFELIMLESYNNKYPILTPIYSFPKQMGNQLVEGATKAIQLKVKGQEYWVTDKEPLNLLVHGEPLNIQLKKKTLTLPFKMTLTKFKMEKDPGTNSPASYESFIRLYGSKKPGLHHVYMNNPLKVDGLTFYQASYSELEDGIYASTLSANIDQGRFLKYLGSLMLVLGAIWHYYIRRKPLLKN